MFDKYINEIKEKPFIISFIIVSIIGFVAYLYHFQLLHAVDEENTPVFYSPFYKMNMIDYIMHTDPRFMGVFLADLISDGSMAKNMLVFINIIGLSAIATIFTRIGLGVKSIFWSILIAVPIFVNPGFQEHFTFIYNLSRATPLFLTLSLLIAMLTKNSVKHILLSTFLLFLAIANYQLAVYEYVGAIIILVIIQIINKQDQSLKTMIIEISKEKIIPSLIVFSISFLSYIQITKVLLNGHKNKMFDYMHYDHNIEYHWGQALQKAIDYIIFNYFPASLHYGHRVFTLLVVLAVISLLIVFKKQNNFKKLYLSLMVWLLFVVMLISINISNLLVISLGGKQILRITLQNSLFIVLLLYLAHLGLRQVARIRVFAGVLASIFVLQLCNQTVYKEYEQIVANQAKMARYNRLYNDIFIFARAHKIRNKVKVFFLMHRDDEVNNMFKLPELKGVKKSSRYLHYDQTVEYKRRMNYNPSPFVYKLGLEHDVIFPTKSVLKSKKVQKTCKKIIRDANMSKWPFYNSMKLVDGIIYVKLTDYKSKSICRTSVDYWSNQIEIDYYIK